MKIAIASGKGGTGKTTIALNLASVLAGSSIKTTYVDCDVEEPNGHIFLKPEIDKSDNVAIPIPLVDLEKCTLCGMCSEICEFSAIAVTPKTVVVFKDMCHGCGGCFHVCPVDAISETDNVIGIIEIGKSGDINFMHGKLDIGKAFSPPIIRELKRNTPSDGVTILDSPPGTSCPVIESISDSDYVILVTEPTPFGVNDLKLSVEMVRQLEVPFGILINRSDIGDDEVIRYCKKEQLDIILQIPDDREIAVAYSHGKLAVDEIPKYIDDFKNLFKKIQKAVQD
jgi:MinD superfamily P-loop ATPase